MWDLLKQTDIEQARQQLELRRAETLRRHAEEIQSLAADQAEIATLDRLADVFSRKFKAALTASVKPPATVKRNEPAVPHIRSVDKPSPKVRHLDQPDQPDRSRTNFDTFSRAVAKAERGW